VTRRASWISQQAHPVEHHARLSCTSHLGHPTAGMNFEHGIRATGGLRIGNPPTPTDVS
jgi:hypothetical protein